MTSHDHENIHQAHFPSRHACAGRVRRQGAVQQAGRPTASDWETEEYQAQGGCDLIKASSMYARGGTGKGVTVGLLDSGATPGHPDLTGKYVVVDSFEGVDPMATNPELGGHGTHVAGIIAAGKDDSGMHGVAHEARVASYALEFDKNDDVVNFEPGEGHRRAEKIRGPRFPTLTGVQRTPPRTRTVAPAKPPSGRKAPSRYVSVTGREIDRMSALISVEAFASPPFPSSCTRRLEGRLGSFRDQGAFEFGEPCPCPTSRAALGMMAMSSGFVAQLEGEGHGCEPGIAVPQKLGAGRVACASKSPRPRCCGGARLRGRAKVASTRSSNSENTILAGTSRPRPHHQLDAPAHHHLDGDRVFEALGAVVLELLDLAAGLVRKRRRRRFEPEAQRPAAGGARC